MLTVSDIRYINSLHRLDEAIAGSVFPINGRFSVVDRAIRRVQKLRRDGLVIDSPDEYEAALVEQESLIVNDPDNLPCIRW